MVGSKEKVCWICDRRFGNGRALGGHQKSHYALLPLPQKTQGQQSNTASPDPTLPVDAENSIGRRSKGRHAAPTWDEKSAQRVTSGHEGISDKEAARCLLMLSKGNDLVKKCSRGISVIVDVAPTSKVVDLSSDSSVVDDEGEDDDDDYDYRKAFNCPYCEKMFGSAQGLGGHKRIHNRKAPEPEQDASSPHVDSKTCTIDLNLLPESEDDKDRVKQEKKIKP